MRGAVSGLGVLNLFAGFAELAPVFAARNRDVHLLRDRDREAYRSTNPRVEP